MADSQQEHQAAQVEPHSQRSGQADELPENEQRPSHGFAYHGYGGSVLDLPREDAGGAERRQEQPAQQERRKTEVLQQLVVVLQCEGGQGQVQDQQAGSDHQHDSVDRLTDRFSERIAGNAE